MALDDDLEVGAGVQPVYPCVRNDDGSFSEVYKDGNAVGSDLTAVFANSDPVNTQKTVTLTKPTKSPAQEHLLLIHNPSTVSNLTVKVFATEAAFGGGSRDCMVASLSVPKKQTISGTSVEAYAFMIRGLYMATDAKLVVSNDTVLGAGDGFTATFRVRQVGAG